ncbi:MAG: 3'-5' exonuclease [Mariprofundales bacterium]
MLNEQQYDAVYHRTGPLLVLAGAGSGKTRVITERIAALMERGEAGAHITAVTFTNKAAMEMRKRLQQRLGKKLAGTARICTFHALGLQIVRTHSALIDRRHNLSVFGVAEQIAALRSILQEMKLPAARDDAKIMLQRISACKAKTAKTVDVAGISKIRDRYDALLQRLNAVDFDDLMLLPIHIFSEHPDVCQHWQQRALHFLVDEYQDSSRVQYDLVRLLAPSDANLTVVGDDDQSIYGWRGAEVRNLFFLDRDYPTLKTILLEQNYRSTQAILTTANTLIAHNTERLGKNLRSSMGIGKNVRIWECDTPEDEAERLAADIRRAHAGSELDYNDFCVLYRASYQSRAVEMALRSMDVPYHVSGGISFFDRKEIADVLAYMRLLANISDDLAFMRAISRPRRGIGEKALADLGSVATEQNCSLFEACLLDDLANKMPPRRAAVLRDFAVEAQQWEDIFLRGDADVAFDTLWEECGLRPCIEEEAKDPEEAQRRLAGVADLRRWWLSHAENNGSLASFMQKLAIIASRDDDEPEGRVRLMTVHAAKGLEFAQVYVIGMFAAGFPHQGAVEEGRLEEERRLMYVAMTRARYRLTLSRSRKRRRFGEWEKLSASPFLNEIGKKHVDWVDKEPESKSATEESSAHMERIRKLLGL